MRERPTIAGATLRARLAEPGTSLLGTFVTIPRVELVEAIGASGFDFVILDCEHGPFGIEAVPALLAAAQGSGMAAVVRTADDRPQGIGAALDAGADGVLVPRITGVESAQRAVAAARLPPTGYRGVHPYIRAASYGADTDYLRTEDTRRAAMVMIEDPAAVDQIAQITALEELDCAFIGPFDLSSGSGMPGAVDHPKIRASIDRVLEVAQSSGTGTGIFAPDPAAASHWLERGVNLVALSVDTRLAGDAFRAASHAARVTPDTPAGAVSHA